MKKEIETEKKYLVVQNGYSISHTNEKCYENDKELEIKETEKLGAKQKAEILKNKFYESFLKKHYENLIFLTAAGTSLDNGKKEKRGKTRTELWIACLKEIDAFETEIKDLKDKTFYKKQDIENLLSYIILYNKLHSEKIKNLQEQLENKIAQFCKLELQDQAPHVNFISKIISRKPSDSRVKLFTTNYDTLFEQAANKTGVVLIDGFSFTQPREFSGKWFDLDLVNRERTRLKEEESFISEVVHLYKLHGSLDWNQYGNKIIQKEDNKKPLIIYPANEKYESSYEQPYFEMMSRFQQALRKENTLLIVIGFGFQDKHIQNVIIEAVEQNPSFQLLIVNYNTNEGIDFNILKSFFDDYTKQIVKRKVSIVFDTFSDFTKNYPENETYRKEVVDESI